MMFLEGYVVVHPTVSPQHTPQHFAMTEVEAWRSLLSRRPNIYDPLVFSREVMVHHKLGYRVKKAFLSVET